MKEKGAIVITESMLAIGAILAGVMLLAITFIIVFGSQSRNVEDTALIAISSSLKFNIERASASASDVAKGYKFPEGVSLNVAIGRKDLELGYANDARRIRTSFASDLNTDRTYSFNGVREICIVNKEGIIMIFQGSCSCENLKNEPCVLG